MASPSVEQRIIRELSQRGTCSFLDLKSSIKHSRGDIEGITKRLADRGWVRIEKDHQGAHISYTWTGPKEKAPGGKSSPTKKSPPSPPGSAPPAKAPVSKAASPEPTWKTKAAEIFRDAPKLAIEFKRYINRLDAPRMDALEREIGTDHMVSALLSCFFAAPEHDAAVGADISFPDASGMRAAAKKATDLATYVAKYENRFRGRLISPLRSGLEISNTDFVDALTSFSFCMNEEATSLGRPGKRGGGYVYGGIILPHPQGKGKRIDSKAWDLVKTLELHFRENLKNHPHHRAIAVLCSATFRKKYTESNIKKILERWKDKSARPLLLPQSSYLSDKVT